MVRNKKVFWGALVLEWFKYLQDADLTSADYKVLFYLCEQMMFEDNTAYLRQKQIAEDLNMNKGNVSKSVKRLLSKQFIAKSKNGFMINPHLFYVGKAVRDDRLELRDRFDNLLETDRRFGLNEDDNQLELNPDSIDPPW